MDADDPESRIAELERQLAQQQRIAELERQIAEAKAATGREFAEGQPPSNAQADAVQDADQRARQYAQAMWEGLQSGTAWPGGPSQPEMAEHREAFLRAAAQAGLSPEQIDDIFKHGKATFKVGHSVVYSGGDGTGYNPPSDVARGSSLSWQAPPRQRARFGGRGGRMRGADLVGAILGLLGICVGGAAALTAAIPSSALWMSSLVCSSGYHLAYGTSNYSYKPGQSGTSVSFECINDADSYSPSWFVIDLFQSLMVALVVGAAVIVGRILWKRLRPNA
jgi:hypothetical protein